MKINKLSFLAVMAAILSSAQAQTIWNNLGDTFSWSDGANWSTGASPISSAAVQIGTQPTFDTVVVDTSGAVTVASFAFNNTLTNVVDVTTAGTGETLQINGAITNSSSFTDTFSLPVIAGATAVWSGPLIFSNNVNIGTNQITLVNAISYSGSNLNFDITNATIYGRFLGAGTATVTGVTINIGGAYTGVASETFDFTSGNFSGATLGTLPTLGGGLTWDTTNFLTNGTLTVVPEPTTWALLAGSLTTVMIFRRRRS